MDSPPMIVENCTFVNFSSSPSGWDVTNACATTNCLVAHALFGTNFVYGPVVQTNKTLSLNLGHLVVTNGERVVFYFWDDLNGDLLRDEDEPSSSVAVTVSAHDAPYRCALPYGGFDANRDGLLDWWQAYYQLEDGEYDDTDGDGLINLHEYWAGTDPTVPDGSNTVLSVAARSVDDLLAHASPCNSLARFENYQTNGMSLAFIPNTNFWGRSINLSCASMWNDAGHDIWGGPCEGWHMAGTAISRRHVICAFHFGVPNGTTLYFMSTSGVVVARHVVAWNTISKSDIQICALDADLPEAVVLAKILPPITRCTSMTVKHYRLSRLIKRRN